MTCGESDLKRDALPKGLCPDCGGKIAFGHAHVRVSQSYAYFGYCVRCDSFPAWDTHGVGGENEKKIQDDLRGLLKYVEARHSASA